MLLEERVEDVEYLIRKGEYLTHHKLLRANVGEKEITN